MAPHKKEVVNRTTKKALMVYKNIAKKKRWGYNPNTLR